MYMKPASVLLDKFMYIRERKEKRQYDALSKFGKPCVKTATRTIYTFSCDKCGREFERSRAEIDIKKSKTRKQFCKNCLGDGVLGNLVRSIATEQMKQHIGRKKIDSFGYIEVYVSDTHPYSDGYCGSIREHVMVMENHLKRKLEKGEVVHHIDGDKTNNELSNLDLCTVQEHNACHATSEQIVFELYRRGLVKYDRETKRYYLP